jgi:hypothetical protein
MSVNSKLEKWIVYWFMNMGILPLLAFCGFIISVIDKRVSSELMPVKKFWKKIFNSKTVWYFIASVVFLIANLYSFGQDIANNHKLINFTSIIWGIYAFIFLKEVAKTFKLIGRFFIVPIMLIILFFGGICDLFPIINDGMGGVSDYYKTANGRWVYENSQPGDIFLNLSGDYYFVLISGRKIYLGGPYLVWSLGYPVSQRISEVQTIIKGLFEKEPFCKYLDGNNIKYVYFNENEKKIVDLEFKIQAFFDKYDNGLKLENGIRIYKTNEICQGL